MIGPPSSFLVALGIALRGPRGRRQPRPLELANVPATVVVGAQWGDEGKGKIVDLLAQESDVVVPLPGRANAGHTIVAGGETLKLRQMPSGVLLRHAVA